MPGFSRHPHGSVFGKIKDKDAYVVSLRGLDLNNRLAVRTKFGYPNRHLKLEWGSYAGTSEEFIIGIDDLEKYTK